MFGSRKRFRAAGRATFAIVAAAGLAGCFDLVQSVQVSRDGSGRYEVSVSAQGLVGQGLKNAKLIEGSENPAETTTSDDNGRITRSAAVTFKSLDELALSNETVSLRTMGRDFFGLGPSHVALRATVFVDKAKKVREPAENEFGEQIAQSILGDHSYSFSVKVPGTIEKASPLVIDKHIYQPEVSGDFLHGHTVTWRVPLFALVDARSVEFETDFVAYGWFRDARTKLAASQ